MRKFRKRFKRPKTPWNSAQIKEDQKFISEYGLRRKKELWIAREILRNFRQRARELIAIEDDASKKTLIEKMHRMGMLSNKDAKLDDILELTVTNVLDRRLQTLVYKRGLATTIKHSRQRITHGHISIDGRKTIFPSYIVPVEAEKKIGMYGHAKGD